MSVLMNKLDLEVTAKPGELIVYRGRGKTRSEMRCSRGVA